MTTELTTCINTVKAYCETHYRDCFREPAGPLHHPFIVPGAAYAYELWDWDSWLTGLALADIAWEDSIEHQKGCVLNFLEHIDAQGRIPIDIFPPEQTPDYMVRLFTLREDVQTNIHKPCLAQHAWFICERLGDASWLADRFDDLLTFLAYYDTHQKHEPTGLYVWINDFAIGVDNEPCTFYRPNRSCASIYLNCLMYQELHAAASLADMLDRPADAARLTEAARTLAEAIRRFMWDEKGGFFYSADVNLTPIDPNELLHSGAPRHWQVLPMRIDVWCGAMPMWCGFATEAEAERIVRENLTNTRTFAAPYGIRSLSRLEPMYRVARTGNPSCWLGPVWGISNYMIFEGLLRYGYIAEARTLAEQTVTLFGRDILACGEMHEYYDPDTGEGVNNQGFQSWNLLCYRMALWLEKETT